MLFNSFHFLIFFPLVTLIYFIIPQKNRYIWLLIASYYFYMNWSAKYGLLLLFSTVITYISGRMICHFNIQNNTKTKRNKHLAVMFSFILNLSVLFIFKYFDFAIDNINALLSHTSFAIINPPFDVVLPVGISFYTFQALSYTMDVYRGDIKAEPNFLKYALFVSFFPQLVAGPIERSKNLLKQINENHTFDYARFKDGFLLMLWGFFLKLVLADRIAIIVNAVYDDLSTYSGFYTLIATVLFAFQIYCDFAGYSTIAMGSSKILGFHLMENFNAPYYSVSVADFWRNWHISLSSWFKDYLYIPLGGNRKGKLRKHINLMLVFIISGLWHGASWHFAIWGGLNGFFQIIGSILKPCRKKIIAFCHLHEDSFGHKIFQIIFTFSLIDFTWIFFRAANFSDALSVIKNIVRANNYWIFFDGSLYTLGLNSANFAVMLIAIGILLFADVLKRRKVCIRAFILKQDYWFRCICVIFFIVCILLFGIWGPSYNASDFIYFQF